LEGAYVIDKEALVVSGPWLRASGPSTLHPQACSIRPNYVRSHTHKKQK